MQDQVISVYNTNGDTTSVIKYHEGFMGQRVAKVSCLAFHPHLVSYLYLLITKIVFVNQAQFMFI